MGAETYEKCPTCGTRMNVGAIVCTGNHASRARLNQLVSRRSVGPSSLNGNALDLLGSLQTTIEFLPIACLLLSRDLTIRMLNVRARQLIDAHPFLIFDHNRLVVGLPEIANRLKIALQECMVGGNNAGGQLPKSFITLPRPNQLPLIF